MPFRKSPVPGTGHSKRVRDWGGGKQKGTKKKEKKSGDKPCFRGRIEIGRKERESLREGRSIRVLHGGWADKQKKNPRGCGKITAEGVQAIPLLTMNPVPLALRRGQEWRTKVSPGSLRKKLWGGGAEGRKGNEKKKKLTCQDGDTYAILRLSLEIQGN